MLDNSGYQQEKLFLRRLLSAYVDALMASASGILGALLVMLLSPTDSFYRTDAGCLAVGTIVFSVYFLLFRDLFGIGKRCMRLVTVRSNELPASIWQRLFRNLTLLFLPLEVCLVLFRKDGRRLGDSLTGTVILSDTTAPQGTSLPRELVNRRIIADLIDLGVIAAISAVSLIVILAIRYDDTALQLTVSAVIVPIVMLCLRDVIGIGKRIEHITIRNESGEKAAWYQRILRNLTSYIFFWAEVYWVSNDVRIGDRLAKTYLAIEPLSFKEMPKSPRLWEYRLACGYSIVAFDADRIYLTENDRPLFSALVDAFAENSDCLVTQTLTEVGVAYYVVTLGDGVVRGPFTEAEYRAFAADHMLPSTMIQTATLNSPHS